MHACMHACIHANIHANIVSYVHTCIYHHKHIYVCVCSTICYSPKGAVGIFLGLLEKRFPPDSRVSCRGSAVLRSARYWKSSCTMLDSFFRTASSSGVSFIPSRSCYPLVGDPLTRTPCKLGLRPRGPRMAQTWALSVRLTQNPITLSTAQVSLLRTRALTSARFASSICMMSIWPSL